MLSERLGCTAWMTSHNVVCQRLIHILSSRSRYWQHDIISDFLSEFVLIIAFVLYEHALRYAMHFDRMYLSC